jgi:hypothetical protein
MPLSTAGSLDCPSISRRACIATACLPLAVATDSLLHAILPRQSNLTNPCRSSRLVKKTVHRLNEISITNLLLQSARLGKLLCTFGSVEPIPGAFATEKLATCETFMPHRQKKEKPYHQSSIDASSPIKHRQDALESPFLRLSRDQPFMRYISRPS